MTRLCRAVRTSALLLAGASIVLRGLQAQTPANLETILGRAAMQVMSYSRGLAEVVIQEDYQQIVRTTPVIVRRTKADMILFDVSGKGWWVPFRDVFEVDGQAVRHRDDRLVRLFQTPSAVDNLAQATAIAEESARFNLRGFGVSRTINTPMTALAFLAEAHQARSRFRLDGTARIAGLLCHIVAFSEDTAPSLVDSLDGTVRVHGRFWIEDSSGRVYRSELVVVVSSLDRDQSVQATVTTTFGPDARSGIWMPIRMDERYDVSRGTAKSAIDGWATYSNLRRFEVSAREDVRELRP